MSFFRKLFGKKVEENKTSSASDPMVRTAPADDPHMTKAFEGYGREDWLNTMEKERNNPDKLYGLLIGALKGGFAADIIPYAEHLRQIEPDQPWALAILADIYMEANRLEDAEHILNDFLSENGDDGVILTKLANVYSRLGDNTQAESTLWHALEIDPNQDNALEWYATIHRDRGGDESVLDAYRRVAALPESWRAQLWLALDMLKNKNFEAAEVLYTEAIDRAECPTPTDLLVQMSSDLGSCGYLPEMVQMVGPYFEPDIHGLQVGVNLIKAYYGLGQIEMADHILDQLYDQNRPDWQETLAFWDTELSKADTTPNTETPPEPMTIKLMTIGGPLWTRDNSPFSALLTPKNDQAIQIAVFGSTALLSDVSAPFSDVIGRLSRALPLIITEQIHLTTDAAGVALIPWAQNQGFPLYGSQNDDQALCDIADMIENKPSFVVGVTIEALPQWKLMLRLIRREDGVCLAKTQVDMSNEDPGSLVEQISETMRELLAEHTDVKTTPPPVWYKIPSGQDSSDYLFRLEQQLAVACMNLDYLKGATLSGEREILDGILQLCVRQPDNQIVRIVFAETIRQMKKACPEIVSEFKEKIDHLQSQHPINGDVGQLILEIIA